MWMPPDLVREYGTSKGSCYWAGLAAKAKLMYYGNEIFGPILALGYLMTGGLNTLGEEPESERGKGKSLGDALVNY